MTPAPGFMALTSMPTERVIGSRGGNGEEESKSHFRYKLYPIESLAPMIPFY